MTKPSNSRQIPTHHHVYTSHAGTTARSRGAGYQTLIATGPFGQADPLAELEAWAKTWCTRHPQVPYWFSFPSRFQAGPRSWLLSKVFPLAGAP